jgi:hypothetical protein
MAVYSCPRVLSPPSLIGAILTVCPLAQARLADIRHTWVTFWKREPPGQVPRPLPHRALSPISLPSLSPISLSHLSLSYPHSLIPRAGAAALVAPQYPGGGHAGGVARRCRPRSGRTACAGIASHRIVVGIVVASAADTLWLTTTASDPRHVLSPPLSLSLSLSLTASDPRRVLSPPLSLSHSLSLTASDPHHVLSPPLSLSHSLSLSPPPPHPSTHPLCV